MSSSVFAATMYQVDAKDGFTTHPGCVLEDPYDCIDDAVEEGKKLVRQYSRGMTTRHSITFEVWRRSDEEVVARVQYDSKWSFIRGRLAAGRSIAPLGLRTEIRQAEALLAGGNLRAPAARVTTVGSGGSTSTQHAAELGKRFAEIPVESFIYDARAAIKLLEGDWDGVVPEKLLHVWIAGEAEAALEAGRLLAALGR